MKLKYSISYFVIMTAVVLTFIYTFAMSRQQEVEGYTTVEKAKEESVTSNNDEVITEGFYLMESNGYVVVYLFDKLTVFEETDIEMSSLPELLQDEIYDGKYIQSSEDLYSFLENYSS